MSVLPATPANLLDLQMQYAQYGVSTQENLGIPSNFVPVVDTWFTFYLSGNQDVYGNYRGYSGVASADFDMQIDVDPTEGTISYVSPTQSVVSFKKYPSASAQFAFISYGLAIGLNNDPTSPSIEYVSGFNVAADSMPYAGSAALTTFSVSSLIINRVQGTCGDTRDELIPMYAQYNVLLSPVCSDFTQTASSSTYSFNDLNIHNTYAFALLRYPIIGPQFMGYGLEMLVNLIGTPVHAINSGYRNPDHNADIGGASNSRHMFGDAVDLVNITQTKTEWAQIRNLAIQAGADYVEPFTGPCGNACVHVDWRNTTGLYAP